MTGLIDCDNFYVSCERLFMPSVTDKPVIVLSNNDGCVVAVSPEARDLGISRGDPLFLHKKIVDAHGVKVFSSNYTLYADISARIMSVIRRICPRMEVYSIDEAFVDLRGMPFDRQKDLASRIKNDVQKWTGIPVSAGFSSSKTLAKVAVSISKREPVSNGPVFLCSEKQVDRVLEGVPVEKIWGVGAGYSRRLREAGIKSALDLKTSSPGYIKERFTVNIARTVLELRGENAIEMEEAPAAKKNITTSRTFSRPVENIREIEEAVSTYVSNAARKLREQKSTASSVYVHLLARAHGNRSFFVSGMTGLQACTADTAILIKGAKKVLRRIYYEGRQYRKAMIILGGIMPEQYARQDLFMDNYTGSTRQGLMRIMDRVNRRKGKDSLHFASDGIERSWRMKRKLLSGKFTTSWRELPVVRA
jgi:DNA polymerase V